MRTCKESRVTAAAGTTILVVAVGPLSMGRTTLTPASQPIAGVGDAEREGLGLGRAEDGGLTAGGAGSEPDCSGRQVDRQSVLSARAQAAGMTTATTPNLLGMRYVHRMMRLDLHRFTTVADAVAAGQTCGDRRARAIVAWLRTLSAEIHHHHTVEDELCWPLIERSAGSAVDLTVLTADHRALDPLLAELDRTVDAFAAATDRHAAAVPLAALLRVLRDELDEHIESEEAAVFPVVEQYVSGEDWADLEKRIRKGGPPIGFLLPRFEAVIRPEERDEVRKLGGPVMWGLFTLLRPAHRRRERLIFGGSAS